MRKTAAHVPRGGQDYRRGCIEQLGRVSIPREMRHGRTDNQGWAEVSPKYSASGRALGRPRRIGQATLRG
jgi:hypothetical protein